MRKAYKNIQNRKNYLSLVNCALTLYIFVCLTKFMEPTDMKVNELPGVGEKNITILYQKVISQE